MAHQSVIFDVAGVFLPPPQVLIRKYEDSLGCPVGILEEALASSHLKHFFSKFERGELLLSEFLPIFQEEVEAAAAKNEISLERFQPAAFFGKMIPGRVDMRKDVLQAVKALSAKGYKTCAVINNWIDDTGRRKTCWSALYVELNRFFDVVVESCKVGRRMPETEFYEITCQNLGVDPGASIFLSATEASLDAASTLGIRCVDATEPKMALKEIGRILALEFTAVSQDSNIHPLPCQPSGVPHAKVTLKSGIKIHYVDVGEGPSVMLFHGFPESWYSWRYQIPALANAGYRAIAMDQRGYGESSVPYDIEEYTQKKLCQDALDLMDCLGIAKTTVIGQDFGGVVVWNFALFHPDRLNGVCAITTSLSTGKGLEERLKSASTFDYQLYFQSPGVAEKELEENLERTFKILFRGVDDERFQFASDGSAPILDTTKVIERGGLLVGFPNEVPRGNMITEKELEYYVSRFKRSGFRGPLNWYRNMQANSAWRALCPTRKIHLPALMITASDDIALKHIFSLGMEERIPNLSRAYVEKCSHWAQMDKPDEVNSALMQWLNTITNHGDSKI